MMSTPKTIPSVLNKTTSITAKGGNYLYITSVITSTNLNVDSLGASTVGPIALSSPIRCKTFVVTRVNQVAYYESI